MSTVWQATRFGSGSKYGANRTPGDASDTGEICISNISPLERRKRLVAGVIQLFVGLAILAVLLATGTDRWWRLALFVPFGGAAVGYFQWRDKT